MKKTTILFSIFLALSLIFLMTILFVGCPQNESSSGGGDEDDGTVAKTYAIGDIGPSGVGIVFYITDGGLHGLEAAPSLWNGGAADPTSAWSTITNALANGVSILPAGIGTGSANTDAIIAQNGGAASAAKLCRDYLGGGKTDWFLPSKDELDAIWDNIVNNG